MREHPDFNVAFQAFDQSNWVTEPSSALVLIWGGLERLFAPSNQELRYRTAATIASYLDPPGVARRKHYKAIQKLYDARSKAAHGSGAPDSITLQESYALLQQVLTKIIEQDHFPTHDELEANLFGLA